ncbi:MAG: A/G-specific adenine glycosylase [Selenomonadaceae bacterium]
MINPILLERTKQLPSIVQPLLHWYHSHARVLPWREEPTPYRVWISEIMLQQTRVETVKPYFERLIIALPTVQSLAAVSLDVLFKLWEGLGYYNRARNLKKAAEKIVADYAGTIPCDFATLLTLPGIGRYTAGAISSIACNERQPAVDGNVLRVIMRLIASPIDIRKESTKRSIEGELLKFMPANKDAGFFNQALMELGATICLPKGAAHCTDCPLRTLCLAYDESHVTELPFKSNSTPRTVEKHTILVITRGNQLAINQRSSKGLLAGLWELPNIDGHLTPFQLSAVLAQKGLQPVSIKELSPAKHVFSHIEWQMIGYSIHLSETIIRENPLPYTTQKHVEPLSPLFWVTAAELNSVYSVPTAFKHYLSMFLQKQSDFLT